MMIIRIVLALLFITFSSCVREPELAAQLNTAGAAPVSDYAQRLESTKAYYPFSEWPSPSRRQFTPIFDTLIAELIALEEDASEEDKIACFQRAVAALNALYRRDRSLIETMEAEQLVLLGIVIASAAGLDPHEYGDGEGPISEGRDW